MKSSFAIKRREGARASERVFRGFEHQKRGLSMVSWTCEQCKGTGREKVTVIRGGKVSSYTGVCGACQGGGSIRNGKAEYKAEITQFRWDE